MWAVDTRVRVSSVALQSQPRINSMAVQGCT